VTATDFLSLMLDMAFAYLMGIITVTTTRARRSGAADERPTPDDPDTDGGDQ
jgi:hypothetical protein